MLFMVIERFKGGNPRQVGERFRSQGRLLPQGVVCHASWMEAAGTRCFQVMEAPDQDSLKVWTRRWDDLVDFEIVPVLTSSDFWSKIQPE
jgi:hypothetical protein